MNASHALASALFLVTCASAGCGGREDTSTTGGTAPAPSATTAHAASFDAIDAQGTPLALAVDATSVAWTTWDASISRGRVLRAPKAAGATATVLVEDRDKHPGLAVAADAVYFSSSNVATVSRVTAAGGAAVDVVTRAGPHETITLAGSNLFWTVDDVAGADVLGVAVTGGDPQPVARLNVIIDGPLVVDDGAFYFLVGSAMTLSRAPGASPATLSDACFYPLGLAADADHLYWTCQDKTLRRVSKTGAPSAEILWTGGWGRVAVDDTTVYLADVTGGRVLAFAKTGGEPRVLADGVDAPAFIGVDETGVYFTTRTSIRRVDR